MDYTGRTQWSLMFVCPADLEAEADRIVASHAEWMQRTHHREGEKALLQYTVTKAPHPEQDDAVVYAMTEIYQSPAGVEDHSKQAHETFEDLPAFHALLGQSEGPWRVNGTISHSLW
ncbi:MAG: hypothetical protein WCA29_07695 [Jiangellales bacterium]